jgi:predicted adenine nucleotide alpha hydrolase (AANH) superfamily ATPase
VQYQEILENTLNKIKNENAKKPPKLLLHSCCAPCSTYVLEYLSEYFEITVFYYNPNIFPENEYTKRVLEQQTLINEFSSKFPVSFLAGYYDRDEFLAIAKGLEHLREGGERCMKCYELRLEKTAVIAKERGFDYYCTTLSISPLKNAERLNEIGVRIGEKHGITYLQSDFKKKDGYKRSIELSKEFGLYRQKYCGCEYSLKEREDNDAKKREQNKRKISGQ